MLHHLHIGSMHLVVRCLIAIVLLQHMQVEELIILLIDHCLVIGW